MIASAIIDILNFLNEHENYNIKIIALIRNKNKILERFRKYQKLIAIEQDVIQPITYDFNVDYIIHAASNAHPQAFARDPVGTMLGNFLGMNNILQYAVFHNCKRVEYISSGEIYGQGEENINAFDENYIGRINSANIRNCYPISKLASENLSISYSEQYGIETVIARPCHIYGPTQTDSDSRASAQFIRDVINNHDIIMKSKGSQMRSYCYVLDCATAILTILTKGKNQNAYNISNKYSNVTIKNLAEVIAKKANKKIIFEIPSENEKKGYNKVTKSVLDSTKLESLGWKARFDIDRGIEATIKILK